MILDRLPIGILFIFFLKARSSPMRASSISLSVSLVQMEKRGDRAKRTLSGRSRTPRFTSDTSMSSPVERQILYSEWIGEFIERHAVSHIMDGGNVVHHFHRFTSNFDHGRSDLRIFFNVEMHIVNNPANFSELN